MTAEQSKLYQDTIIIAIQKLSSLSKTAEEMNKAGQISTEELKAIWQASCDGIEALSKLDPTSLQARN